MALLKIPNDPNLTFVRIHGYARCSDSQVGRMNEELSTLGKRPLNNKIQLFRCAIRRDDQRPIRLQLGLSMSLDGEEQQIVTSLTVIYVASSSRVRQSQQRVNEFRRLLDVMGSQAFDAHLDCTLHWEFAEDELKLPFRLPFDLPFVPGNDISAVIGFRAAKADESDWVIVDRLLDTSPDHMIHVTSGFTLHAVFDVDVLDRVATRGASLAFQVVTLNDRGLT